MLNQRELRIGNIVDLGIVKGVYPSDEEIYSIWLHNGLSFSSNKISGEPLTEEWLVKLGITERHYDSLVIVDIGWKIVIEKSKNGYSVQANGEYQIAEIKYVHQLQNLYFALTGEELELKQEAK